MINDCQHPKTWPPSPPRTQGHIVNEKSLELYHWKQELVFLIQIIRIKERKRQNIPWCRWGKERKPNIYKGLFSASCIHYTSHLHLHDTYYITSHLIHTQIPWNNDFQTRLLLSTTGHAHDKSRDVSPTFRPSASDSLGKQDNLYF